MPLIPAETLQHFEKMIYLPMVIQILEKDRETFENNAFKFKGLYIHIVETALKIVRAELKETTRYAQNRKMKLRRGTGDGLFTEYVFTHNGYEDCRKYLNVRLRNQTEELIYGYITKAVK